MKLLLPSCDSHPHYRRSTPGRRLLGQTMGRCRSWSPQPSPRPRTESCLPCARRAASPSTCSSPGRPEPGPLLTCAWSGDVQPAPACPSPLPVAVACPPQQPFWRTCPDPGVTAYLRQHLNPRPALLSPFLSSCLHIVRWVPLKCSFLTPYSGYASSVILNFRGRGKYCI